MTPPEPIEVLVPAAFAFAIADAAIELINSIMIDKRNHIVTKPETILELKRAVADFTFSVATEYYQKTGKPIISNG